MLPGSKITAKPKQITSRCRVPHAKDDVESLHRCLDGHLGKRIFSDARNILNLDIVLIVS